MKEQFYFGRELQKDLDFCQIMGELNEDPRVLFLSKPEVVLVRHMECDPRNSTLRFATDITHIGYDRHYATFLYGDQVFYVQASEYYPFTDVNHPGKFNFIAHNRIGMTKMKQCSYYEKYQSLESIQEWLEEGSARNIKGAAERRMDIRISECDAKRISGFTKLIGGFREQVVLESNPVFLDSGTWNDEHKVVRVISNKYDLYGYRSSFDFDLMTNRICG